MPACAGMTQEETDPLPRCNVQNTRMVALVSLGSLRLDASQGLASESSIAIVSCPKLAEAGYDAIPERDHDKVSRSVNRCRHGLRVLDSCNGI